MLLEKLVMVFFFCQWSFSYELPSAMSLQLIIEYAKWRSWKQIVLFDDFSPGKSDEVFHYARPLLSCLGKEGMSLSIQPTNSPKLPEALEIRTHRVGAILFLDRINFTSTENVLKLASNKRLFDYFVSWLLITTRSNDASIDTRLRNLTIGINTDVIIATADHDHHKASDQACSHSNRSCRALREYAEKYKNKFHQSRFDDVVVENATKNLKYSVMENRTACFYLAHIYKIRANDNSSLVVDPLGAWSPGIPLLKFPINVSLRSNFSQTPIIVGVLNGSNDDRNIEVSSYHEDQSEVQPFNDFIDFLANSLNASLETVAHEKVGTLTNKVWSNLLGDVYNGNVDIGLGYITINAERQRDMSFTHPLIRYTRNIYIRPPESGTMRDIFLQPFNNRLFFCVALMQFFIIATIGAINYAASNMLSGQNDKKDGIGEATLWCASIMCMQGSPWNPSTFSGKTALLASLIFSLVTYNAYAGFITSILSVQATGIRTLEDLLSNNFKLGYSDIDDEYMRNANDSDLRQLYIKAFNGRESGLSTTLGLQKAVKGGYGFFVSATLARRALRTSLIHERCSLKEIEIKQTFTIVALPMEKNSPYEKIINLSILRMSERGVITRIGKRMLPDMPKCHAQTTFHSARIADVYSAFIILVIGMASSFCLGLLEQIWYQRKNFKLRLVNAVTTYKRKGRIVSEQENNHSEESIAIHWQKHLMKQSSLSHSPLHRPQIWKNNSRDFVFPFQH